MTIRTWTKRALNTAAQQRFRMLAVTAAILSIWCHEAVPAADVIERSSALPESTPWNLAELSKPPQFEWIERQGPAHSLLYSGETYRERPTRVFAYYATPGMVTGDPQRDRNLPGVVLVHGGGGTAFREWAELWAKRGYAAIAMDLAGSRPIAGKNPHQSANRVRLDSGGPGQSNTEKFDVIGEPVSEHWPYHAVANVIRAHSLLRSLPNVDAERTAITGISWGGYLTCLVASLDHRFRAAVPVYGCGYLHENSAWTGTLNAMTADERERWIGLYDPSRYFPACRVPIFFINGTNDFAYPLDSYMKSFSVVPAKKNIRITVNMPHGHPAGWAPAEIGAFIDQYVLDTVGLPKLERPILQDGRYVAAVEGPMNIEGAALHYSIDAGAINKRQWTTVAGKIEENSVSAPAPPPEATAWFLTVTDEHKRIVSSEVILKAAE